MSPSRRPTSDFDQEALSLEALQEQLLIWVEAYVVSHSRKEAVALIKAAERVAARRADADRVLEMDEGPESRAWRVGRRAGRERVLRTTTLLRSKV